MYKQHTLSPGLGLGVGVVRKKLLKIWRKIWRLLFASVITFNTYINSGPPWVTIRAQVECVFIPTCVPFSTQMLLFLYIVLVVRVVCFVVCLFH